MPQTPFPEDLLHLVWKMRRFEQSTLKTTDGQDILIINPGIHNHNAGPDFLNAKIKIGSTEWHGHVEIHINAGDWRFHNHHTDPAYDNVILHVVYHHNADISRRRGGTLPTLELKGRIEETLLTKYEDLALAQSTIPCENILSKIDLDMVPLWIDAIFVERLERKTEDYKSLLLETNKDWEYAFFIALCERLGSPVNKEAFRSLATSIPYQTLLKHKDNLHQLESLLFGLSGLIPEDTSNLYSVSLKKEFAFLQKKYHLNQLNPVIWRFAKMRPPHFPTVRLAQLAFLIHREGRIFNEIRDLQSIEEIRNLFSLKLSEGYWYKHYTFSSESNPVVKTLGKNMIDLLIINLVAPYLFLYGKSIDDDVYIHRSFEMLEQLKPESNHILKHWKSLGVPVSSSRDSQALIQLRQEYCDKKRCLHCPIGYKLLS